MQVNVTTEAGRVSVTRPADSLQWTGTAGEPLLQAALQHNGLPSSWAAVDGVACNASYDRYRSLAILGSHPWFYVSDIFPFPAVTFNIPHKFPRTVN